MWWKEQRLGYLQQRCTHLWSLRVTRSANLCWGDGKVTTFAWYLSVTRLLVNICNAIRLWQGSGCGTFHGPLMSLWHNLQRSTDRERFGYVCNCHSLMEGMETLCPMPQFWTIAGCQGHVLGSSAENLMSGCTCHLFITVCTGRGSGMQNPLANIHWRFLLKSEMIGAPKWIP